MVKQREARHRAVFACLGCNLCVHHQARRAGRPRFRDDFAGTGPAEAAAEADATGTG
jgi:hypothetical protein